MKSRKRAPLAAVLLLLLAPASGAAPEQRAAHHHSEAEAEAAQLDPQVAGIARRLWGDLVCLCDRCERLTLSACHCPDAAAERKNVIALLRSRDLSTPGGADAAYQAVIKDYVQRKGRTILASERPGSPPGDWLALVASVGIGVLGCAAVAAIELRRRRKRRSGRPSRH